MRRNEGKTKICETEEVKVNHKIKLKNEYIVKNTNENTYERK